MSANATNSALTLKSTDEPSVRERSQPCKRGAARRPAQERSREQCLGVAAAWSVSAILTYWVEDGLVEGPINVCYGAANSCLASSCSPCKIQPAWVLLPLSPGAGCDNR